VLNIKKPPNGGFFMLEINVLKDLTLNKRFIPNQPEDTRSELLWKNQYSRVRQLPTNGTKSACRFGTTKASKHNLASSPFISR